MGEIVELITKSNYYNVSFYKITNNVLKVDIKGSNDALIVLTDKFNRFDNYLVIFYIGISYKFRCIWISDLKTNRLDVIYHYKKDIITNTEFKTFWLTWIGKKISFGEPYQEPMLVYDLSRVKFKFDNFKFELNYVGFASLSGEEQETHWRFEIPMKVARKILPIKSGDLVWVKSTHGIPENAVIGGVEDGHPLYVIRAEHGEETVIPGKYSTLTGKASIPWYGLEDMGNSVEIIKEEYEFLCGYNLKWVSCQFHDSPRQAFDAGEIYVSGEYPPQSLYITRARHEGNLILGTVADESDVSASFIPYKGKVIFIPHYEILCESFDETEDESIIVKQLHPRLHELYDYVPTHYQHSVGRGILS